MARFVAPAEVGSLLGQAVIFDEQTGFSLPLQMHNITSQLSNSLQMPGTPFGRPDKKMGFPASTSFATQLLLTNTADSAINITATLDGRNSSGKPVSWNAPTITLAAFESRVINLEKTRLENDSPIADGYVGVRLVHTGKVIDLMAEAVTVDQTLSFSFYEPFFNANSARRLRHAVSFNLADTKNTLLVVKNSSGEAVRYGYTLNYKDGDEVESYTAVISELAPYEVKVIEIKSIRDAGIPDAEGRLLPINLSFGNASLYTERAVLIAGDPTFDPVAGISSSRMDWHTASDQRHGGITPQNEPPDPICDDPCYYNPSICVIQAQACITCCNICNNNHDNCVLLATAALATATAACTAGVCTAQGADSPGCIACLAAAATGFTIALVVCGNTRENCRATCALTPNCGC